MNSILIVDDEQDILQVLAQLLQNDFLVFTADNAADGLEILQQKNIHVVISDQWMPLCSGVEFLEQVMTLKPDTIRILITGYSDLDMVIDAINRGHIYKYLTKPWNAEQLIMEVTGACRIFNLNEKNRKLTRELQNHAEKLETKVSERTTALNNSNKRFQTLIESIPDWVWELDNTYHFSYSSMQSQEIIGYTAAELLGKCPLDFLFEPEDARLLIKTLESAPPINKTIRYSLLQVLDKSGHQRYLESNIQIQHDNAGQIIGYIGVSRNVTNRKQFQQMLIQHEKELALLLEASKFITTLHNPKLLMQSILKGATLAINSDSGCLFLFDEASQCFSIGASVGFSDSTLTTIHQKLSRLALTDSKGIELHAEVGKTQNISLIAALEPEMYKSMFDILSSK